MPGKGDIAERGRAADAGIDASGRRAGPPFWRAEQMAACTVVHQGLAMKYHRERTPDGPP